MDAHIQKFISQLNALFWQADKPGDKYIAIPRAKTHTVHGIPVTPLLQ